jgi:four helix bundle protein
MRDHTKLRAFELADEVALIVYQVTKNFPKEEVYGLTSQMRRAAVSVASNIVEGYGRDSLTEYVRFLDISFGSFREVHYQASLAARLGFLNDQDAQKCEEKMTETEKVLASLIRSLRTPKT